MTTLVLNGGAALYLNIPKRDGCWIAQVGDQLLIQATAANTKEAEAKLREFLIAVGDEVRRGESA